ncbi:hypothetical protein DPV78_002585 [Talaromyces pinophilus]|nr:hypothetical protein DPV78_002585 [Talaromyces pinophilus]
MESSEVTNESSQGVKRRRVAVACDACRTRKSRCDGARPRCSICINLGFECNYTPPSSAANLLVKKEYVFRIYLQSLESRIAMLEDHMGSVDFQLSELSRSAHRNGDSYGGRHVNSELGPPTSESLPDLANIEDSVDAMGAVIFADEEDYGFFGPSSNISFLRHLSLNGTYDSPRRPDQNTARPGVFDVGFANVSRPPSPVANGSGRSIKQKQMDLFALPPPQETLKLVQKYFSDTGLLFPYIYPPTFLETLQYALEDNLRKIRRTWLGLLNMMLAMVKLTDEKPAETRIAEANMFYQRALGLCGNEMLRGTTTEVVQFLLLMGQYLQGTQKSVQAWTIHGLAVKAAFQLGLHSKHATGAFSPLDQETRRRTWYACIVLDRTLSMTLGRPASIPDSYVRVELPKHDENLIVPLVPNVMPQDAQMSTIFFNKTILLYQQLFFIIDQLYGQNLGCDEPISVGESITKILSISQSLEVWERSLPENLSLVTLNDIQEAKQPDYGEAQFTLKFRLILTLRYLHLQILLHRPILVKFIDACSEDSMNSSDHRLLQQIGSNSLQVCSESAMNIVDMMYEVLHSTAWHKSLLGAWWFSLYYTFHSALILLGTIRICKSGGSAVKLPSCDIDRLTSYPNRAVQVLYRLDSGNRIVDRCRYYLERYMILSDLTGYPRDLAQDMINNPVVNNNIFNMDCSPLGLEFGEFMLDGDFLAVTNQHTVLPEDFTRGISQHE